MPNSTVISFLSSLLSYGMGFSKMLVFKTALIEHPNNYDYTIYGSQAMSYFVLAIFFAVIGLIFFVLKKMECKQSVRLSNIKYRSISRIESDLEEVQQAN